jgi:hypothetical protein
MFTMRELKLANWFVLSCGPILGLTGIAKLMSVFGHAKLLAIDDPIVGIPFRYLMLLVGCIELILAFVCLYTKKNNLALACIAGLATAFAVYRLGLWWLGWEKSCACMGNLTDALTLPPKLVDSAMIATLLYLLIGSYSLLFISLKARSNEMPAETQSTI